MDCSRRCERRMGSCWQGELSNIIINKKNAKITGCDLIKKSDFKNKNFKYIRVNKKNNFPFKDRFDYIVFADVLEHVENPQKMIKNAFEHTGKCIISIPNLDFFLYKIFPKLENPPVELTPHIYHWNLNSFKKILPKNVKIKQVGYCTDFPEFRWSNYLFPGISFFHQTIVMKIVRE